MRSHPGAPLVNTDAMLVGREAERRAVDAVVAGARLGRSGVLVLTGEAGIGKTSLLEYAGSVADGATLLRATGSEAERDVPFGGLAQLFRATDADLDRLPPPQAQALGVALALRSGPVADRLAVGAAVLSLLVRWSEDRPLGLLVDDAHLLDRPSAEALAFACRRLLADPVFVLAAARVGEPGPLLEAGLPARTLVGLDLAGTGELARARGADVPAAALAMVHRATGGNPLAVIALADEPDRLRELSPDALVPVPARIAGWFGRRVAGVGPDAHRVLLLAAAGDGDLATLTRACSALGLDAGAVAAAERTGLVTVRADRVEFTHPLARASVHAAAEPGDRRAAHRALAAAVPDGDVDRRAWHLAHAALGPDPAAAAALEVAGERAADRGAYAVAATAYGRAAQLTADAGDRARRLLAAGTSAWRGGDAAWAGSLLAGVPDLDPPARVRAEMLGVRGDMEVSCGSPERAQRLLVEAATLLAGDDPSRAVLLLGEAVWAGVLSADAVGLVDAATRAERLLDQPLSDTARAVGTLAAGMARVFAGRSGAELVRSGVELLAATVDPAGAPMRPEWLMLGPLWLRESGTGRTLVRAALDEGRARSAVSALPLLLFMIARDGATTEHWASAEADYGEAIGLARELGQTTLLALLLAGLSWLEARQGQADACRRHAEEALALCGQHPVALGRTWAEYALGELALVSGDVPAAVRRLGGLLDLLDELDIRDPDVSPAPELVEALLRSGRAEEARELAVRYGDEAAAKALPWALARAARVRGLLCPWHELDARFAEALELHARTPDVFEAARTTLAYGARLRRARRRADARGPLREALDCFDRLGARPWADLAAAELEATGATVARRGGDERAALTPRELQISLLLAEGRTTRETAAALFLSPKTVEYHLRHVYTKLGIASRAELAARLPPDP
jgi:DNA-binding CsgD family transcriptional regulator